MSNSFKNQQEPARPEGKGLFASINKLFRFSGIFDEGVPIEYLPKIIWITVLLVFYIANAHYTEKTIRKIDKLKFEVQDLRTEYITLKAGYMFESKQSEIAKKVADIGLQESKTPPLVLKLND